MIKNKFEIGDIVTLKSHPLAFDENGMVDMYINQIPPLMCVKEIHIEKKKQIYSNEIKEVKIGDNVKYLCVYFNQHRMIFEEKLVYQEMLIGLKDLKFHSNIEETPEDHTKLVEETQLYSTAKYEYGKRVFFKTYKLEKRKKTKGAGVDNRSTTKTFLTHTSPPFILNGYRPNEKKSFYNQKNGELQHKYSEKLFKVLWYNAYQEKISEDYLPKEFFTDDERIFNHPKIQSKKKEEEQPKE